MISFQYSQAYILLCILLGVVYALLLYFKHSFIKDPTAGQKRLMNFLGVLRFLVVSLIAILLLAPFIKSRFTEIQKPIILLLQEKAEVIEATEQRLRAQSLFLDIPLVIRLVRYIKIPRRLRLPCSRRGVLTRDRETCQYCGVQPGRTQLTVDHVLPRSRNGQTTWENVVTACRECNHRKGGRTPEEANMVLATKPRQPQYVAFALLGELERHDVWKKYAYSTD